MSASYRRLRSLVHPPGSRVTQNSNISQFNTGGRGIYGRRHGRRYRDIGFGCVCVCGRSGRGGRGGSRYGHNSYEFASRYGTFVSETRVYTVDRWRLISLQQNNIIQEIKICEGCRLFDVPPAGYKLDNEGKSVVYQFFFPTLTRELSK